MPGIKAAGLGGPCLSERPKLWSQLAVDIERLLEVTRKRLSLGILDRQQRLEGRLPDLDRTRLACEGNTIVIFQFSTCHFGSGVTGYHSIHAEP